MGYGLQGAFLKIVYGWELWGTDLEKLFVNFFVVGVVGCDSRGASREIVCGWGWQRYFGTAVGKGRQAAKTEIERLKLDEITCEEGVGELAKM